MIHYRRMYILILVLISFIYRIHAQNNAVIFDQINTKNGLTHNRVFDITKDAKGYMWFATLDGLNRYDGYNFKNFKHNILDSTTISENYIEALFIDKDDNLWIGTNFSGLNKFVPETESFIRYEHDSNIDKSIANESVQAINQLKDGRLIIGTNNGLSLFSIKEETFLNFRNNQSDSLSLVNNEIKDILIDHKGTPWIGTTGGVSKMNIKTNTFINYKHNVYDDNSLSDDYVLCLAQTSDSLIWIGTANGLNCFNTRKNTIEKLFYSTSDKNSIHNNYIHSLEVDIYGHLWVGTTNGITKILNPNHSKNKFYHYRYSTADPNSLSGNKVWCLYMDNDDLMWVGTVNHGISKCYLGKYVFNNEKHLPHDDSSLSHSTIRSLLEDSYGNLWVGTDGGGLNFKAANQSKYIRLNDLNSGKALFGDDRILDIFESKSGEIWVGTWGAGVSRFKTKHISLIKERVLPPIQNFKYHYLDSASLGGNIVQDITQDSYGNIWFGTEHGLSIFNPYNESFYRISHSENDPNSLCDNRIQSGCILEDSHQQLWIGTWNGISRIKLKNVPFRNGVKTNMNNSNALKFENVLNVLDDIYRLGDNRVISMLEDNVGNIWVGTFGGGLNKIDVIQEKPIVTKYDITSGLPDEVIYGIEKGNADHLWLSTNNGLSHFNPMNQQFTNYTESDDLQGNEFYWGAHLRKSDGELIFGGTNGFSSFYPDSITTNKHAGSVIISGMSIFNVPVNFKNEDAPIDKPIEYVNEITLSHNQNVISFEYTYLNFHHPEQIKFSYMLQGFEKKWNNVEDRRTAIYTNLEPGKYVFKVKITNQNESLKNSMATLAIKINRPYYKSIFFRLGIILMLVVMGITIYRLKLRTIRKQQKMLQEKVAERTIELTKANQLLTEKNIEIGAQRDQIIQQKDELEDHRKGLEDEVKQRTKELIIAKNKAEESDKLKSAFLANMSHEIRTPLNAVVGFASLLNDNSVESEERDKYVRQITQNSDDLLILIDDIIDLSHIEVGQLKIKTKLVDVNSFIKGIFEIYKAKKLPHEVEFKVSNNHQNESISILTDPHRLRQIVINLINNALKFTEDGFVEFGFIKDNDVLKFFVKDTGIGISKENQRLIFERFRKIDGNLSKLYRGSGLGLTISKKLSELLDAKLSVISEVGKGSTFFVTLSNKVIRP